MRIGEHGHLHVVLMQRFPVLLVVTRRIETPSRRRGQTNIAVEIGRHGLSSTVELLDVTVVESFDLIIALLRLDGSAQRATTMEQQ